MKNPIFSDADSYALCPPPFLKHLGSDFDADDWGNVVVPTVSLLLRHLPH